MTRGAIEHFVEEDTQLLLSLLVRPLDECLLDCLSQAGTVSMGEACYEDCVLN